MQQKSGIEAFRAEFGVSLQVNDKNKGIKKISMVRDFFFTNDVELPRMPHSKDLVIKIVIIELGRSCECTQ